MQIKNNIVKKENNKMSSFLASPAIKQMINNTVQNSKEFCTSLVSLVSNNPAIAKCENSSVLAACLLGESLHLPSSPTLGYFYCVPFNSKNGAPKAQFILGYKGYVQLAARTGAYKKINVLPVKAGELARWDPLNEEIELNLIENEAERAAAPTTGYYAMFEYINGFRKAIYWSREKMMAHAAQYSKAFNAEAYKKYIAGQIPAGEMWRYSSFWYKDFDAMGCKTMLRQLIGKWGITSADMVRAMESEEKPMTVNNDGIAEAITVEPEAIETAAKSEPPAPAEAPKPEDIAEIYEGEVPTEEDPFLA